jgi:hypothetical protein
MTSPGFKKGQGLRPLVLHHVRAAAVTPYSAIHNINPVGVEEVHQRLSPPPLSTSTVCAPVMDGRIAHQKRVWQLRTRQRLRAIFACSAGSVVAPSIGTARSVCFAKTFVLRQKQYSKASEIGAFHHSE